MTAKDLDGLFIVAGFAVSVAVLWLTGTLHVIGPAGLTLYACATLGAYYVRHKRGR